MNDETTLLDPQMSGNQTTNDNTPVSNPSQPQNGDKMSWGEKAAYAAGGAVFGVGATLAGQAVAGNSSEISVDPAAVSEVVTEEAKDAAETSTETKAEGDEVAAVATETTAETKAESAETATTTEAKTVSAETATATEAKTVSAETATTTEAKTDSAETETTTEAKTVSAETETTTEAKNVSAEAATSTEVKTDSAETETATEAKYVSAETETSTETKTVTAETTTEAKAESDNFANDDRGTVPEPEDAIVATATGVRVAHVDDDASFSQAFADARAQVGPGGIFEWHGRVYATYYKDEWDGMSANERHDFQANIDYNDVLTDESIAQHHNDIAQHNTYAGHYEAQHTASQQTNHIEDDYQQVDEEIDVRVLDVAELDLDMNGIPEDAAILDVNGHEIIIVDIDSNGVADVAISDIDGNGVFEINNISDEGIYMPTQTDIDMCSAPDLDINTDGFLSI